MRLRAFSTTLRSLRAQAAVGIAAAPCSAAARQRRLFPSKAAATSKLGANRGPLSVLRPPPPPSFAAGPRLASAAAAASEPPPPPPTSPAVEVDVRVDGSPLIDGFDDALREAPDGSEFEALASQLEADAAAAAAAALRYSDPKSEQPPPARLSILSLVLCDDATIAALNEEWRGVEGPTDVLSFPQASSSVLGGRGGGEGEGNGNGPSALPWEVLSQFQSEEQQQEEGGGGGDGDEETAEGEEKEPDSEEESTTSLLPPRVLGDLVLSLDTARRQALERNHSLRTECRVLLVHGALHLLGYDHEMEGGEEEEEKEVNASRGEERAEEMARAERAILRELKWDGEGLIDAATKASERRGGGRAEGSSFSSSISSSSFASTSASSPASKSSSSSGGTRRSFSSSSSSSKPKAKAVAIDLDGTLLTSSSRACLKGAAAAAAAAAAGVSVVISTGKARPAAAAALEQIGLGGVLVSSDKPGVFLQGLASYGRGGRRVAGGIGEASSPPSPSPPPPSTFPYLPASVVRAAFEFAAATPGVSAVAFTGDECFSLEVTRDTDELHSVYHEPLPRIPAGGIEELLFLGGDGRGGGDGDRRLASSSRVLKMLFVAEPARVESELKPYWRGLLSGKTRRKDSDEPVVPFGLAAPMQAVPNMLELVPAGVDKGRGLRAVLRDLGIDPLDVVAVGDGGNDLPMMRLVGTPVAMGNAVAEVKRAARHVVGSNDECGVAEAIERFVL